MRCLYNYIGLLGCGIEVPESGLYINTQPGITTESIAAVADNEQENYLGAWEDIQQRAILKFNTLVLSKLKKRFKIKLVLDTVNIGKEIAADITFTPEAQWRGINVIYTTPEANPLTQIQIQEVVLYLSEVSSTTVKIFDVESSEVLFTAEITEKSGWVKINVGKSFNTKNIFIAYDATAVTQTSLPVPFYQPGVACSCADCTLFIHGGTAATDTPTTITNGEDTFGLTAVVSLKCALDNLVCNNKELFANAWMNLLSAEVMTESMYSNRINRWTTVDRKRAEELRQEFDNAFIGEINNVVDSLEMHDGCCVECQDIVSYSESSM